jgi:hypothetical protein
VINLDHRTLKAAMGGYGGKYIATTDPTTPDAGFVFVAIQVITPCVVTLVGNITGITAVSLDSGTVIYGRFTIATLGNGSIVAYSGV